ncbi:hypothetical protein M378DRAFT_648288 [Amanita muscaria Koide BX008]|uniref:Uncharacterized protein n=1 Tax=Amanita muscaria (strain Koide BX008) TaxID=946122 RepID=A0A0C2X5E0_AMAMK|nr:hypothetical protein M378DRAFT_648288 [Amanita muscaria Koide BX008]
MRYHPSRRCAQFRLDFRVRLKRSSNVLPAPVALPSQFPVLAGVFGQRHLLLSLFYRTTPLALLLKVSCRCFIKGQVAHTRLSPHRRSITLAALVVTRLLLHLKLACSHPFNVVVFHRQTAINRNCHCRSSVTPVRSIACKSCAVII